MTSRTSSDVLHQMVRPEPHEDQNQNFSGSGLLSLSEAPPPDGLCLTCAQVKTFVDPVTNCVRYHTPRGRFLHVPPAGPRSDWDGDIGAPWWADHRYQVGLLSAKTRRIRVVNTLMLQEQPLQVCSEETLEEILQRYLRYNSHARSYTWKHDGEVLDMSRTLSDNHVPDHDQDLEELGLDPDLYTPAILLYFNDDLTEQ
uniref:Cytochrome b5 domain containing 1 n=1 Tax=Oryzias sinensis TaxID=183150 RepID=A0A8C7YF37_9TELE